MSTQASDPLLRIRLFSEVPPDEFSKRAPERLISVVEDIFPPIDTSGLHECTDTISTLAHKRGADAASSLYPKPLLALASLVADAVPKSQVTAQHTEQAWSSAYMQARMAGPDDSLSRLLKDSTTAKEQFLDAVLINRHSLDLFLKPCIEYTNSLPLSRQAVDMTVEERFQERVEDLHAIYTALRLSTLFPNLNTSVDLNQPTAEAHALGVHLQSLLERVQDTHEKAAFVKETDRLLQPTGGLSMDCAISSEYPGDFDLCPRIWRPSIKGLPHFRQMPGEEFPQFPPTPATRWCTYEESSISFSIDRYCLEDSKSCLSQMSRAWGRYAEYLSRVKGEMESQDGSLVERLGLPTHIGSMIGAGHRLLKESHRVEETFDSDYGAWAETWDPEQSRLFTAIKHHSLEMLNHDRLDMLNSLEKMHHLLDENRASAINFQDEMADLDRELKTTAVKTKRYANRLKAMSEEQRVVTMATTIGDLKDYSATDTDARVSSIRATLHGAETRSTPTPPAAKGEDATAKSSINRDTQAGQAEASSSSGPSRLIPTDDPNLLKPAEGTVSRATQTITPSFDLAPVVTIFEITPPVRMVYQGPPIVSSNPDGKGNTVILKDGDEFVV